MTYQKIRLTKPRIVGLAFGAILAMQALVPFLIPSASAGSLSNTLVRVDRLAQSQTTGGMVCAKAATTATEAHVQVTFPGSGTQGSNSFGVNSTASNWTTTTTNLPSGATPWIGIGTATNVTGAAVTFPSGDMVVGTLYCFNFASASTLSTPTNNGTNLTATVVTQDSTPSTIDSGTYAMTIVGAGLDQVTVSATVNPTFLMSLSSTTDALGTLSTGSVATSASPIQATISTNAANGWYLWGKSANQALHSNNAAYNINSSPACSGGTSSSSTLSAGTEGYNLGARVNTQGSGSGGTAATAGTGLVFDNDNGGGGATLGKGAGLCSTYQTIANSNGTANAAKIDMKNSAAISGVTKAASDYTDLETFVGAGVF